MEASFHGTCAILRAPTVLGVQSLRLPGHFMSILLHHHKNSMVPSIFHSFNAPLTRLSTRSYLSEANRTTNERQREGSFNPRDSQSGRPKGRRPTRDYHQEALRLAKVLRESYTRKNNGDSDELDAALEEAGRVLWNRFRAWYTLLDKLGSTRGGNSGSSWPLVMEVFSFLQTQPWFHHDPFWYSKLISLAADARRPDDAWALLLQLQANGGRPNLSVCNALIRALSAGGKWEEARELLDAMKKSGGGGEEEEGEDGDGGMGGCRPDVVTYNSLLSGLAKAGKAEEAESLLREMEEEEGVTPTVVTYSSLIHACGQAGRLSRMMELYGQMKETGRKNTQVADGQEGRGLDRWESHVGGRREEEAIMSTSGNDKWMDVESWSKRHGEEGGRCSPNMRTFNTVLGHLGRAGRVVEMERVVEDMEAQGVLPDVLTWNALIGAHAKAGNLVKMEEALGCMRDQGLRPNAYSFTSLFSGMTATRDFSQLERIMEEVYVAAGASRWISLAQQLEEVPAADAEAAAAKGEADAGAGEVEGEAPAEGSDPPASGSADWAAHVAGAVAASTHGDTAAFHPPSTPEPWLYPDGRLYTVALGALAAAGRLDALAALYQSMRANSAVRTGLPSYGVAVKAFARAGRLKEMEGVVKDMEEDGKVKPDEAMYAEMARAYASKNLFFKTTELKKSKFGGRGS